MKRGKPLPYRSAKRISAKSQRDEVLAEVELRDGYRCYASNAPRDCGVLFPWRKELEGHEIIPRSAWSVGWLVASNVILVCQVHHEWINENPDDAEALGLHGKSWDRPDGHAGLGVPYIEEEKG